jgi:hypothetical protein
MVDALTRWPSFSSSPWIRWYPQPWFSVASRSNQRGDLGADWGPSRPVRVVPFAGDQESVAVQDGAGGDHPVHPQPWRQEVDQRRGSRGRPSPAGAADWPGAGLRPRAAERAAREVRVWGRRPCRAGPAALAGLRGRWRPTRKPQHGACLEPRILCQRRMDKERRPRCPSGGSSSSRAGATSRRVAPQEYDLVNAG